MLMTLLRGHLVMSGFCGEGVFWRKMDKFEGFCTGKALRGGDFLEGMFCQSRFYK